MINADWSPVEKGLNWAIGREIGPFGLPTSPSGKIGPREIADGTVGEGSLAGERGRVVEEGAGLGDELLHIRARIRAEIAAGMGAGEEGRRPRLLQRDVGAEDRRVRRAHQAERHAIGVDHRDGHLRPAVERLADLRAGASHNDEGLFEDRADLGGRKRRRRRRQNRSPARTG